MHGAPQAAGRFAEKVASVADIAAQVCWAAQHTRPLAWAGGVRTHRIRSPRMQCNMSEGPDAVCRVQSIASGPVLLSTAAAWWVQQRHLLLVDHSMPCLVRSVTMYFAAHVVIKPGLGEETPSGIAAFCPRRPSQAQCQPCLTPSRRQRGPPAVAQVCTQYEARAAFGVTQAQRTSQCMTTLGRMLAACAIGTPHASVGSLPVLPKNTAALTPAAATAAADCSPRACSGGLPV